MEHPTASDPAAADRDWAAIRRWEVLLLVLVVLAIGMTRFSTLDNKLLEAHPHRQTQTAIQTVGFYEDGIDLLKPPLPVLGAPFTVPFEFPLFQAIASVPMAWGVSADAANRVTALGFFTATALLLWVLVRLISNRQVAAVTLVAFSFSPFGLLWSRAALIESLATAATLAWVLSMLLLIRSPRWWWIVAGVLAGSIATTVKVTTALPWLAVALAFRPDRGRVTRFEDWIRPRARFGFLTVVSLPIIAALVWTRHADSIKESSQATLAMTSTNLQEWATGTLAQRLDGSNLGVIVGRIDSWIVGPGWLVLVVAAVILAARHRETWLGIALVPVVAIGAFFNLYVVHDYYLAAVAPAFAALLGLAIWSVVSWLPWDHRAALAVVITALWLGINLWLSHGYWSVAYEAPRGAPHEAVEIAALTDAEDLVMVGGVAWDPRVLYYAHRKGLMLYEPFVTREIAQGQPDLDQYRALYLAGPLSHLAEWAAIRPFYAPVTANTLLLGADLDDLGAVELAATTHDREALLAGEVTEPVAEFESVSITCDGIDQLVIPAGSGSLWLTVDSEGEARAVMRSGIVPVPSESSTLIWSPAPGETTREEDILTCINEGVLHLGFAALVSADPGEG